MILIFDLDDTLYDERTYVNSGLWAVANHAHLQFGWAVGQSYEYMQAVLQSEGRGRIFDLWLGANGRANRAMVKECVRVYRHHTPLLTLAPEVNDLLATLSFDYPLYLVTDGHKIVQQKKVEALGISRYFRKIMITHRYGIHNAKPSTYCFDLIRKREGCEWHDMAYIGDNPAKDFVNLNLQGVTTIRVKTGVHRNSVAKPEFDANTSIAKITDLLNVIAHPG